MYFRLLVVMGPYRDPEDDEAILRDGYVKVTKEGVREGGHSFVWSENFLTFAAVGRVLRR